MLLIISGFLRSIVALDHKQGCRATINATQMITRVSGCMSAGSEPIRISEVPSEITANCNIFFPSQVFHDGQVSHYLDGKDEANSSWMRFVRCARHKKEQNMVVFQYHGCVYYRTIREILPGQELLVWYDTRYSQFMGVPVALSDSGSRGRDVLRNVKNIVICSKI